jgi:hypothetical protein
MLLDFDSSRRDRELSAYPATRSLAEPLSDAEHDRIARALADS